MCMHKPVGQRGLHAGVTLKEVYDDVFVATQIQCVSKGPGEVCVCVCTCRELCVCDSLSRGKDVIAGSHRGI